MNVSDSVIAGPVTPTTVRPVPRSVGDASPSGVGKPGLTRLASRPADAASKSRMEVAEGNLQLEDVL